MEHPIEIDEGFSERQAARLLGISAHTLRWYRGEGRGPAYHQVGRRVIYKLEDLNEWLSARRVPAPVTVS